MVHGDRQGHPGEATLSVAERPDFGDGKQNRDFVYVGDRVDVILWLLQSSTAQDLFNVGGGMARSLSEVADPPATTTCAFGRKNFRSE